MRFVSKLNNTNIYFPTTSHILSATSRVGNQNLALNFSSFRKLAYYHTFIQNYFISPVLPYLNLALNPCHPAKYNY